MALSNVRRLLIFAPLMVLAVAATAHTARAMWGMHGHTIAGRAAATRLPVQMPLFFREASAQLAYLNPEPDRWRADSLRTMNEAFQYDHYIDFEVVPDSVLAVQDRWRYLTALGNTGLKHPAREAGLLPFRILELHQRLTTEFRLWRTTTDPQQRRWIQERIINDAGILGHYVTDAANPLHTSVHHNGWAKEYPNPNNYTTENTFHRRFETQFVGARVTLQDLLPRMNATPRHFADPRAAVMDYLRESHSHLERLYQIEQRATYNAATTAPENKAFAVERLAFGTNMLRDLWWSAWLNSAPAR